MAEQTPDANPKQEQDQENQEKDGQGAQDTPRQKSRRRLIIFYEDTDDAQINGHLIQLSSRINGNVVRVEVEENQQVKAGDLIAELDPKDYQTAVQQDEANLEAAEANLESARVNVPVTNITSTSGISSAGATLLQSNDEVVQSQHQLEASRAAIAQADANYIKAKLGAPVSSFRPG